MRRRLVDRRGRPRFEIIGDQWGSIEAVVALQVRDISRDGALVTAEVSLPADSEHHVTVICDGTLSPAKVRVRHIGRLPGATERATYLIGLEFLKVGPVLRSQIDSWLVGTLQPEA